MRAVSRPDREKQRHAGVRLRDVCVLLVLAAPVVVACAGGDGGDKCQPPDADGVVGGKYTVGVTVDDDGFTPTPITTQNTATVTVKLRNSGTVAHGFEIGCVATPNDTGCPEKTCFPSAARIAPIAPGEMGTATFVVPLVEAIYPVTSTADGDGIEGQFVVQ